ncbi:MAG TPA: glycosyltransferase family 39 protein, partial [Polyangiaceae bacterium]|nr:glycosyltransferase family 39 protein [Polyangiaceae bacterium]
MPSSRALSHALLVALARVFTSLLCLWSGFRAISDDDYSRTVIAARFAQHPSLDPSGTSWLPAPFWLYGVPMALFSDSLFTARAVALVAGAASAVLVWLSARALGLSERGALWGALGAVVLPYGAWLSAAMVPEAPTAALVLFGVVTLSRNELKLRLWGGVALGAACFCRYEAWAPALTFALLTGLEAARSRRRPLWLA